MHIVCPHCSAINRTPASRPAERAKCGSCHRMLFEHKPFAASAESFGRHLAKNDLPVLVDFWAPWCGRAARWRRPMSAPRPSSSRPTGCSARYQIRSIPTLMLFRGGEPVARTAGAMSAAAIVAWARAQGVNLDRDLQGEQRV